MKKDLFFPSCDRTEISSDEEHVYISQYDSINGDEIHVHIPRQLIPVLVKRLMQEVQVEGELNG